MAINEITQETGEQSRWETEPVGYPPQTLLKFSERKRSSEKDEEEGRLKRAVRAKKEAMVQGEVLSRPGATGKLVQEGWCKPAQCEQEMGGALSQDQHSFSTSREARGLRV